MLDKIKGVLTVRDEMDSLKAEIEDLKSIIKGLGDALTQETSRVRELHDTQGDMLSSFLQANQTLAKLREDIRREIEDFRMLNRQAQSKIMDKFEQEISNALTVNTKALELDKAQYEKVRSDISKHGELLSAINAEMNKLLLVSTRIKSQDFQLSEHHQKLLEDDKNKLQLMQRIDELERMIGKMKQGRARDDHRQF